MRFLKSIPPGIAAVAFCAVFATSWRRAAGSNVVRNLIRAACVTIIRAACVTSALCVFSSPASAQLPFIQLKSLSRPIITAGSETELTLGGSRLDEVDQLRFSHSGITAEVLTAPPKPFDDQPTVRFGQFRVRVAKEVPPGRYDVRAVGRFGISNPRTILVHALPTVDVTASHQEDQATELTLNQMHQTAATSSAADHYRLHLAKGAHVVVQLVAQSIESRMIGVLTLRDSRGKVLSSLVGADHIDRSLTIDADKDSDYFLEVHDVLYRGGGEYRYGLAVAGDPNSIVREQPRDAHSLGIESVPGEFIDEQSDSVDLPVPARIESTFSTSDDEDHFVCSLKKDQPVSIDIVSHRLGEPTDVRLIVQQAVTDGNGAVSWKQVAIAEDSHSIVDSGFSLRTLDPSLTFRPPADGNYRLIVRDLDSGETLGKVQRYRLAIEPVQPNVRLLAFRPFPNKDANASQPFGSQLLRGGSQSVRLIALRSNWSGPIRIRVNNLPDGVTCPEATMAANRSQVSLTLTADANAPSSVTDLDIVGLIRVGDADQTIPASFATYQWERTGQRAAVRSRLTNHLSVRVSDQDRTPLSIQSSNDGVTTCKKGEKPKLTFQLGRTDGSKEPVIFRARDLPPGVSAGDVTVAKDKDMAEISLNVSDKATPGTYTLWFQCETKVKFAPNPQAVTKATEYKARLQKMRDDPSNSDQNGELDKAIEAANKQIEAAKKGSALANFTVYLPAPTVTLKIE